MNTEILAMSQTTVFHHLGVLGQGVMFRIIDRVLG